jgi:hypothetical protein
MCHHSLMVPLNATLPLLIDGKPTPLMVPIGAALPVFISAGKRQSRVSKRRSYIT